MYQSYPDETSVRIYLEHFVTNEQPIVVGEFGDGHWDDETQRREPVDEDAILAVTQELQIGWMAWSWSGNEAPNTELDLVADFEPSQLTTWGDRVVNGQNGLRQTSVLARGID